MWQQQQWWRIFFWTAPSAFRLVTRLEAYSRTSGESNHHRESVRDTRVPQYQLGHEDTYSNGGESVVLGTVDVKDSFLVDQVTHDSFPSWQDRSRRICQDRDLAPVLDIGHSVKHSVRNLACHGAPNRHAFWKSILLKFAISIHSCKVLDVRCSS